MPEYSQSAPVRVLTFTSSIVCAHPSALPYVLGRDRRAADLTEGIDALEGAQEALCHRVRVSCVAQPAERGEAGKKEKESLAGALCERRWALS